MLGILIQLGLSWLLLWMVEKKNLSALGLMPTALRFLDFALGFGAAALLLTAHTLATTTMKGNTWSIHHQFSFHAWFSSAWWTIKSVLFEELLFRGALLYLLLQRTSLRTGCLISATAFGVYHWFSMGVLGNLQAMVFVFIGTGIWGLMFAYAFGKTRSLYLPIGLHLGWNFFNIVVFSQGPLGKQWLIVSDNGHQITGLLSIGLFLFQWFGLPLIVYYYLRIFRKNDNRETINTTSYSTEQD
ncbi:MAG: CPBP family intramembrane metalloprotease [Saprospiraceae bacterium]|nr:CPBP family intramembrane metalloprotease [Saprospiraceae bacterium]